MELICVGKKLPRFLCCGFQECNPSIKQESTIMGNVHNEHNSEHSEVVDIST